MAEKDIYFETVINKKIVLESKYLNKKIDENIVALLANKYGNKCINEGYLVKDDIKIINKGIGEISKNNLDGSVKYNVTLGVKLCNPMKGNIISCEVIDKNKIGVRAINKFLNVLIFYQYHTNKNIFDNINIGDKIDIVVVAKRFYYGDDKIDIVGRLLKDISSKNEIIEIESDEEMDEDVEKSIDEDTDLDEEINITEDINSDTDINSDIDTDIDTDINTDINTDTDRDIETEISSDLVGGSSSLEEYDLSDENDYDNI